jgi:hypothetical protein
MNRVHPGVNSRFSPEAILIFRKIGRGWGGISESPPWDCNQPTGPAGTLGRPQQARGRMPCDHGTHRLRVSGSSEHTTDLIQIAPALGRAAHPMAAACCRPGPTGPPARVLPPVPAVGVSLSGYSNKYFNGGHSSRKCSAPAPVAEIARLQVVSAAPHAYPPDDAHVLRLTLTLRGIRSGTVSLSPETMRSCIARNSRRTIPKKPQRLARGEGRCERCSTIDFSKRPSVFSS